MKHESIFPRLQKGLHLLFIAALIASLSLSLAPAKTVGAQGTITTSDLAVSIVYIPKHAKACQTFTVTFRVTNLGPDPASQVYAGTGFTDQFDSVDIHRVPLYLAVGETVTITESVKVTAFVPGESREGWVSAGATSDAWPDTSIDPNLDNNYPGQNVRLISKPVMTCP